MHTYHISTKELLVDAWVKTKQHYWFLFCVGIFALILRSLSYWILPLDILVGVAISISVTYVLLTIVHGHTPRYRDLIVPFKTYKIPFIFFVVTLLVGVSVAVGFLFLILPGVYLAVRLQFYRFIVLEKSHMGVIDVFKESLAVTKGHFWKLFWFGAVLILFNILGLFFFVVGLFITIPVSLIAHAELYKKMALHRKASHKEHQTTPDAHGEHVHDHEKAHGKAV